MNFVRSNEWVSRRRARGGSFDSPAVRVNIVDRRTGPASSGVRSGSEREVEIPTLGILCLRSLESSLGKGLATFDLQDLPLGLAETVYDFVASAGSRMAHMEILRALAPILRQHVSSLDFSRAKIVGDSALLELANGCDSSLVQLNLSSCCFITDGALLATLLKCPGVKDLTLSGCRGITDETAYHLPHRCTKLTTLNLAGLEGITGSGVAYIAYLPALEQLCLARCNVSDAAVVAITTGVCRQSLRWLDLTCTAISAAAAASLRDLQRLEYLALSSTSMSAMSVAALARDLRLPAFLPEAPKTRARSSRALLLGSKWSETQLRSLPKKRAATTAATAAGAPAKSWRNSIASVICYERDGPSKAMRLIGAASRVSSSSSSPCADDLVEVGFRDDGIEEGGRKLLLNLVQGIVRLWPAVPSR
ncbi:Hypothetical leucine rich repeat protein [Ectocarpus siliculosus]|uniref:Hypothetical leucine rich repeat protein n=1 Tax=Ectocarpus siliculosus TaxID=2880 RepID=D7FQD2_ECTSI|nr:Hypothetical leucine rich repeat protein [Ectocarpus siliculosus]|eukprot:CBJ48464.1 Hypothetical leucine rich repeat protein [Ectocarpus siliculosus]